MKRDWGNIIKDAHTYDVADLRMLALEFIEAFNIDLTALVGHEFTCISDNITRKITHVLDNKLFYKADCCWMNSLLFDIMTQECKLIKHSQSCCNKKLSDILHTRKRTNYNIWLDLEERLSL